MVNPARLLRYSIDPLRRRAAGWHRSSRLPASVLSCLERRFHLSPGDMLTLGAVERRGPLGVQSVRYIRIFDRAEASRMRVRINGYRDLDKHPELIAFEGHIAPSGQAYLRLRRDEWKRFARAG